MPTPSSTPANYYITNNLKKLTFKDTFSEQESFAFIDNIHLLSNIYSMIGQKELPQKLHITLQEGFQGEKKGFSARHIFARDHLKYISQYYEKTNSLFWQNSSNQDNKYLSLIKILNLAFYNINNLTEKDENRAMLWCNEKSAFIFVIDTGIKFNGLQHLLIVLYPSDKNKLTILTLYLISANSFKNIKLANNHRYKSIFNANNTINKNTNQPISNTDKQSNMSLTYFPNIADDLASEDTLDNDTESYEVLASSGIFPSNHAIINKNLKSNVISQIKFLKKQIELRQDIYKKIISHGLEVTENNSKMNEILNQFENFSLNFNDQDTQSILKMSVDKKFFEYLDLVNTVNELKEKKVTNINQMLAIHQTNLETNCILLLDLTENFSNKKTNEILYNQITSLANSAKQESLYELRNELVDLYNTFGKLYKANEKFIAMLQPNYDKFFNIRDRTIVFALTLATKFISFILNKNANALKPYASFVTFMVNLNDNDEILEIAAKNTRKSQLLANFKKQYITFYYKFFDQLTFEARTNIKKSVNSITPRPFN